MKVCLAALLGAAALSGCASFDRNEIASVRGRGVSPQVVEKLDRGHAIAPADAIELTHRLVPDEWIIRQIEDHDVDSLVSRRDVAAMRRAGVHQPVIEAMLKASDRFQGDFRGPRYAGEDWLYGDAYGWGYGPSYGYPFYGFGGALILPIGGHRHHHH